MANDNNTLNGSYFLFKTYILPHIKNLKYLVIGTDIDRLKFVENFWENEVFTYPRWLRIR